MTEKTLRKEIWEAAGYAGLALGMVSVAYMYIGNILNTSGLSAGVVSLIGVPLWIAKFVGCILLMKFFMKKIHSAHPGISDKDLFRMGALTALLSAFFFSAVEVIFGRIYCLKKDHMTIILYSDLTTSLTINRTGVHGDKSAREYEKAVFA